MIEKIYLTNGRWANKALLDLIKTVVNESIPRLVPDGRYTLKSLCGEYVWHDLGPGDQRQAGWCMKHLVIKGDLPLTIAKSKHEYPIRYQLK